MLSALYVYDNPTPFRSACRVRYPPAVNDHVTPDRFCFTRHVPSAFLVNVAFNPDGALHDEPDPVNVARNPGPDPGSWTR